MGKREGGRCDADDVVAGRPAALFGGGGGLLVGQGGLEMDGVDGTRDVWVLQWRPQGASGGLRPYLALAWELQVWVSLR